LPAAAVAARVPLSRVNGWLEMGAMGAIAAGLYLAYDLHDYRWPIGQGPLVIAAALNLVSLVAALPVRFSSDSFRPEALGHALAGFFRDVRRIVRQPEPRGCLLGLACLRGLMAAVVAILSALALKGVLTLMDLTTIVGWLLGGLAVGAFLAGRERHPRRVLGLVPLGVIGLAVTLLVAALDGRLSPALCVVMGLMAGLIHVPLLAAYQAALPADARGNGMAVRNLTDALFVAIAVGLMFPLAQLEILSPTTLFAVLLALTVLAIRASWWALFRELLELAMEIVLLPIYRVRGHGPGLDAFPSHGPALVVANHSAWFDPVWLAKVLPRRLIPMMTSVFYDLPVIRWLMVHVAHAIRVQASTFRRQAPELKEAVAALDRGECVIIFPEGSMRKSADRPLRNFGQGVWHILRDRPDTPVVVCWIEGGWESFFSYFNGPPTRNKRLDFLRRIDIAVGPPLVLPAEVLADQKATRAFLMHRCLDTRSYLVQVKPDLEKIEIAPALTEDEEGPEPPAESAAG
jgi:1-acyl-sn-glycerol-3-phosphate acyltransferase